MPYLHGVKRLISIALLASFLLPFYGGMIYLYYQKKLLKKEVKRMIIAGIDKEELLHLQFTAEEHRKLNWEHSKEFSYNGEMYDVVVKKVIGKVIHYWCLWDNEETKLNKHLHTLVEERTGKGDIRKDREGRLIDLLKSLYCSGKILWKPVAEEYNRKAVAFIDENYLSVHLSPPVPPPQG